MAGFTVDQFGSPATPRSLPIHRTSGPASEKMTAPGWSERTSPQIRAQSYSCRRPPGPTSTAPSNQTSLSGPYRVSSSVSWAQ